ncbi:hypothetical protein STRAU_3297 [Streptomyces aurantiacus JA 4570]|uniref:Uncharacterized protein n=1 Tax=Streptomyces aurantiacus JA 4570 TaxID=1286094 RepID=S3ZKF8_9ACTN|nr:hypothetical protein STRAU_3297 [Streptomyces aurantiacus JA 4570]
MRRPPRRLRRASPRGSAAGARRRLRQTGDSTAGPARGGRVHVRRGVHSATMAP